jgi:hypothetical protein
VSAWENAKITTMILSYDDLRKTPINKKGSVIGLFLECSHAISLLSHS